MGCLDKRLDKVSNLLRAICKEEGVSLFLWFRSGHSRLFLHVDAQDTVLSVVLSQVDCIGLAYVNTCTSTDTNELARQKWAAQHKFIPLFAMVWQIRQQLITRMLMVGARIRFGDCQILKFKFFYHPY